MPRLRSLVKRGLATTGWELRSTKRFDPPTAHTIAAVRPYTMTTDDRIAALCDAVRYIVRFKVPGDIVECGVWAGGSMIAAARTLRETGDLARDLYLFDTFEGMSEPTSADIDPNGVSAADLLASSQRSEGVWCYAPIDQVRQNLASSGYPSERFHLVQGKVEDTVPSQAPQSIALLRLDTDWYESTRHELAHLIDRVSDHGILIIDDYGHWAGARKAVDEWLTDLERPVFLSRIDESARIGVVPARPR